MNTEEDIEKRSIWTNVALFMVGIAILAFIPKLRYNEPEPAGQQNEEQITNTTQSNQPENALILQENIDNSEEMVTIPPDRNAGSSVNLQTNYTLENNSIFGEQHEDMQSYIECRDSEDTSDDLIMAAK